MTFPVPPLGMASAALLSNDDFLPAAHVKVGRSLDVAQADAQNTPCPR